MTSDIEQYKTSPGWYEHPSTDKALRENELRAILSAEEESEGDGEEEAAPAQEAQPEAQEPPFDFPILKPGARGPLVEKVQALINASRVTSVQVDGLYLRVTENAVFEFQERARLDRTGIVDPRTWRALLTYES